MAYAPALVLLAVGIVAIAAVPPVSTPVTCGCPTGGTGNATPCLCPVGYETPFLGVVILLAAVAVAGVYSVAIRRVRRG